MRRVEKINFILNSMEAWNYDDLLMWAQDTMRMILDVLPDEDVDSEYEYICEDIMQ